MAKHNKSTRINIPMCAACVLLCLTLLSIHLTSGLYAKYTATATGSDSARVAKFEVDVSGQDLADITCTQSNTDSSTYTITITNTSEVAVQYKLSLLEPVLPNGVTYSFAPETGTLAAGNNSADSTLTFTVDWAEFTADNTGDSATETLNFTVNVHIEQID